MSLEETMRSRAFIRNWRGVVALLVTATFTLFIAPCLSNSASWFNGSFDYIDISSGRVRSETLLVGVQVSGDLCETAVSRAYSELVGRPAAPEWRIVCSQPIMGGPSPHYAFHGAIAAVNILDQVFGSAPFTDEARKKVITEFLGALQTDGSHFRASDYALAVYGVAAEAGVDHKTVDGAQLPASDGSRPKPEPRVFKPDAAQGEQSP